MSDVGNWKVLASKYLIRKPWMTVKGVNLTMVTTEGLEHVGYWNSVQSEVTLQDLFK